MSMMQRQVGMSIPTNTGNNPMRDGKEYVKAITLCSSTILESPSVSTPNKVDREKIDDPLDDS